MSTTKFVQKKNLYCSNCGKLNHDYKHCNFPVTSYGIILVNMSLHNNSQGDLLADNVGSIDIARHSMLNITKFSDQSIICNALKCIQFLMISRKHSLGYTEFIRGRYKPHLIDQTIHLFRQMKQEEIDKIKQSMAMSDGFDYLWKDVWNTHITPYLQYEKNEGRIKYDTLKFTGINSPDISLEFLVENVHPDYLIDEWGFPKGRRNKGETDEECAIREFKEETGYTNDDFFIVREIKPIKEIFTGTNGIKYCHIYYVAELLTSKPPQNNITQQQKEEIGDIKFFDYQSAFSAIRAYHIERKIIVRNLFSYYVNKLIEQKHTELS